MKNLQNFWVKAGVVVGASALSVSAQAASLLPADVFTGVQTNVTDTITAIMTFLVPIGIAAVIGKAVLGWTKGGTAKAIR